MKIIITGGLGYIGMALIDEYRAIYDRLQWSLKELQSYAAKIERLNQNKTSGEITEEELQAYLKSAESIHKDAEEYVAKWGGLEVWVIDKEFIPSRIVSLRGYPFKFVEQDITQDYKEWAGYYFQDADIVYHLAALIEAEASINRPEETYRVNYYGTLNVANAMKVSAKKNCKFVFASTANVFGGVKSTDKNASLTEDDVPNPRYPYAESKYAAEQWIRENLDNYVVCRFGTAFGYSDGIRFNLFSNLFIKNALLNKSVVVHGTGHYFRPVTHVRDLAGASVFLAHGDFYREVFHVVWDNYMILGYAEEVLKVLEREYLLNQEVVPGVFMSYHLSSKKLRNAGYVFKYNLKSEVLVMKDFLVAMQNV